MGLKLIVVGNLGRDATVNIVGENKVINFSVPHTEKWGKGADKKEKTTWVECAYWVKNDAIAQYLKKGQGVQVIGTPSADHYTSGGEVKSKLTLRVEEVELIGGKPSGNNSGSSSPSSPSNSNYSRNTNVEPTNDPDDLPF